MKHSDLDELLLKLKILLNFEVDLLLEGFLNILGFFKVIPIQSLQGIFALFLELLNLIIQFLNSIANIVNNSVFLNFHLHHFVFMLSQSIVHKHT